MSAFVFVLGLLVAEYHSWYPAALIPPLCVYACIRLLSIARTSVGKEHAGYLVRACFRVVWICGIFALAFFHTREATRFRTYELTRISEADAHSLVGEIYKKEFRNGRYLFYLTDCIAVCSDEQIPCNRVLLYLDSDTYSVGETIWCDGKLNTFKPATNEGQFDAKQFYESQQIDLVMYDPSIRKSDGRVNRYMEFLYDLRLRMRITYENALKEQEAGVLSVMLLGEKAGLDEDTRSLFQASGISHILAISGLHVSLIGMGIYRFLRRRGVGYKRAFLVAAIVVFCYAQMTGMGVSTARAVIMLFLSMLADVRGRGYDLLNALGLAVILLLWENPFWLGYAGFVFSVSAILSIAVVGACLTREKGKIGNSIYSAVAVWISLLPITAYYYYEVPIYSVLLNLLVLPLMKYVFLFGVAGGLTGGVQSGATGVEAEGFVGEEVGGPVNEAIGGLVDMTVGEAGDGIAAYASMLANFGFVRDGLKWLSGILLLPCSWIIRIYIWLADASQQLPKGRALVGAPSTERMVLFYAVLMLLCILWKKYKKGNLLRLSGILLLLFLFFFPQTKSFEVDVLDVGQGDGIYICTQDGAALFIDGGSSSVDQVGKYRILPFLKYHGVSEISYWFVSHADADHISGLTEVLESGYTVRNLVVAEAAVEEGMLDVLDDPLSRLILLAQKHGTQVITLSAGDELRFSETEFVRCIYPGSTDAIGAHGIEDRNDLSLVLWYENETFSGVFTGDISAAVEERILTEGYLDKLHGMRGIDLYKAAHHGSKYSNSEAFLEELSPQMTVISVSSRNHYGHPHEETLLRLKEVDSAVYRTNEGGQIRIYCDKAGCVRCKRGTGEEKRASVPRQRRERSAKSLHRILTIYGCTWLNTISYMTDGSGMNHMKYNDRYADRLGENPGELAFLSPITHYTQEGRNT